jgi:hypothetical protein
MSRIVQVDDQAGVLAPKGGAPGFGWMMRGATAQLVRLLDVPQGRRLPPLVTKTPRRRRLCTRT